MDYRRISRVPLFSQDKVVCNMARKVSSIGLSLAKALASDMVKMIDYEKNGRLHVCDMVRKKLEYVIF